MGLHAPHMAEPAAPHPTLQGTALLAGVKRPAPAARGAFRCVAAIDVNKSIIGDVRV